MKFQSRLVIGLSFSVATVGHLLADFQPCSVTAEDAVADSIRCSIHNCTGTYVHYLEQKACQNEDEAPCSNGPKNLFTTAPNMNCYGIPGGGCAPQTPPCSCDPDLSNKVVTGGGSTC